MGANTSAVAADTIKCAACSADMRRTAAYCPRCGRPVDKPVVNLAKVRSPIPRFGLFFITAGIAGPLMLGAGLYWGIGALLYLGIAITLAVVVLLVLGLLTS